MNYKNNLRKREDFDPNLSPDNPHNIITAERLELIYDEKRRLYLDSDGCPVRDQFGQELG